MNSILQKLSLTIKESLYPIVCVSCKNKGSNLCPPCLSKLILVRTLTCPDCGVINNRGEVCTKCSKRNSISGLISSVRKGDEIRNAVMALKYRGVLDIHIELATILTRSIKNSQFVPDIVVAVPTSSNRLKIRGYNHSQLLAKEVSRTLQIPFYKYLKKIKRTAAQVGLKRNERLINLVNAFRAKDTFEIRNKKILLIDDVATTLSTLNNCAVALKKAGAKSVWGAVLYKD